MPTENTKQNGISVFIHTSKELGDVRTYLNSLINALNHLALPYEIIFLGHNLTEKIENELEQLRSFLPLNLIKLNTKKDKQALPDQILSNAQYNLVLITDTGLGITAEMIGTMLSKLANGSDIVTTLTTRSSLKHLANKLVHTVFVKSLHNIPVDVNPDILLFKYNVLERLKQNSKKISSYLELIHHASHAGYITEELSTHSQIGKPHIKEHFKHFKLAGKAIALKIKSAVIFPFLQEQQNNEGKGFHYKGQKYIAHSDLHHKETALYRTSKKQQLFLLMLVTFVGLAFIVNWHTTAVLLVAVITIVYFMDLLFNLFLIYRSFSKSKEIQISTQDIADVPADQWPMYTIFCPLYKEHEVIPQFVSAMNQLDYPKDKLQIMLLLEENDKQTIDAANKFNLPSNFEIVVVPHSLPKTKPKACNYGLLKAKGEYVVIYDAEDVPDADQLKKAVLAFKKVPKNVICIQAKLNFYNPHQNILTRAFTAEYSLWFDLILTGLQSINAPIPLGGTSNHFITQKLKELRGWDAFNVTEDCDLGMRLVKKQYKTAVLNSTTLEEANSNFKNWFRQRSRWVKGYIQSYFVHMRNPKEFIQRWNEPHVITFQLIVGGKVLSMFINPLMWVITISYFTMRTTFGDVIESFFPPIIFYMALCSLVFGNFLYLYYYMIGCAKREHDDLIKYALLIPIYWLMMSVAAWIALYEFIVKPHYWQKTKHGLHINNAKAHTQAAEKIGRKLVDQNIFNPSN
jgi:cellulose synthase/poly-beta-1,6-N-acetylglucosamine synthase-like glycosyltransferase